MLRALAVLLLTTAPALTWEAKSDRICELFHEGENASVHVTYDPAIPEYSIAITPRGPWRQGPIFAMRFDGPRGNMITTDRNVISRGGATLTVTDRGFGNDLNGLEFNHTAMALLGNRAVAVPLDGEVPTAGSSRSNEESHSENLFLIPAIVACPPHRALFSFYGSIAVS